MTSAWPANKQALSFPERGKKGAPGYRRPFCFLAFPLWERE